MEIALRTLVLDDGSTMVEALVDRLRREGVPFDRTLLAVADREELLSGKLASVDEAGVLRARYSGIIGPSLDSPALTDKERDALLAYRDTFRIRLIRTNTRAYFPEPTSKERPGGARFDGVVDGITATVTRAARDDVFSYLRENLLFDASDEYPTTAAFSERPVGVRAGYSYVPLVSARIPGSTATGALVGVLRTGVREEMLINFDGNVNQTQVQVLTHGMLRWLNRGIATAHNRNFFSVHNDDILLPNAQWVPEGHCESGRNCPPSVPQLAPVRMVAEDVDVLVRWQSANHLKIDQVMNGSGAAEYAQAHGGRDPLMESIVANKSEIRPISHTWSHQFLGCLQILMADDWRCQGDASGQPIWRSEKELRSQIAMNQAFMAKNKLENHRPQELVTGEHSGLAKPPQQMEDNPHLAAAFEATGIVWTASDASTEMAPRRVGPATTVPRHPIDLDYNTPTARQVVDQYNWLHTSAAVGGSGKCETDPDAPCVDPVDLKDGFATVLAPTEGAKAYGHVIGNDARPHFIHQVNLTGERLIYPILDDMLARYRATFDDDTPLLNPTMTEAGTNLVNHQGWADASGEVQATVAGAIVRLTNDHTSPVHVPLTLPEGSLTVVDGHVSVEFGERYSDARSAWVSVAPGATVSFQVPEASGFATEASWPVRGVA